MERRTLLDEYTIDTLPDFSVIADEKAEIQPLLDSGWVFYTQVEVDDQLFYLKGQHFVNRTGMYAAVKPW